MQAESTESRLFMLALAVVVASIVAILSFALGLPGIVFYGAAIIAIGLGFYMSYTLSREQRPAEEHAGKPAARKRARK
ncbi:MAG: hypothetical protein KGH72_01245 [Candidatus Micrarchaeota archaeon]|nr:hypothetical protein [Candidatus Micrarchaeota archaeon]